MASCRKRRADWLRLSPLPPRSPAQRHVTARRSYGRGSCAAGRCGIGVRGERGERRAAPGVVEGSDPAGTVPAGSGPARGAASVRGGGARCGSLRVSGRSASPFLCLPQMLPLLCALLLGLGPAHAAPAGHEVTFLPGLPKQPSFRHFSGHLCIGPTQRLHYWYVGTGWDVVLVRGAGAG